MGRITCEASPVEGGTSRESLDSLFDIPSWYSSNLPDNTMKKVCDTTYVCERKDGTSMWVEEESVGTGERAADCNPSILNAIAFSKNCLSSIPKRGCSGPFVTDGDTEFEVAFARTLPSRIPATQFQCTSGVDASTHSRLGAVEIAGLNMWELARNPPPSSTSPSSSPSSSSSPTPPTCAWTRGTSHLSCRSNDDCPVPDDKLFREWWTTVSERHPVPSLGTTASRFLRTVSNSYSFASLDVDLDSEQLKKVARTAREMRTLVEKEYVSNPEFRKEVRDAIRDEYPDMLPKMKEGLCSEGKCPNVVKTTVRRIFDGSRDVSFKTVGSGGTKLLTYSVDGSEDAVVEGQVRCDTSSAPARCSDDSIYEVKDRSLTAGSPDRPEYLVSVGHAIYLVDNRIHGNGPEDCAAKLCERNRDACPSLYCRLDEGGSCVPRGADKVVLQ